MARFRRRYGRGTRRRGRVTFRYGRVHRRYGRVFRRRGRARRRTNTRSASVSLIASNQNVMVGQGGDGTILWFPIPLQLTALPGFSEYLGVYSRVRVLSCEVIVLGDAAGTPNLTGGYLVAPAWDVLQRNLRIDTGTNIDQTQFTATLDPTKIPSEVSFSANVVQANGDPLEGPLKNGSKLYTTVCTRSASLPCHNQVSCNGTTVLNCKEFQSTTAQPTCSGCWPTVRSETVTEGGQPATYDLAVLPRNEPSEYTLPGQHLTALQQLKRVRTYFPSAIKRSFRIRFTPFTFVAGSAPLTSAQDVAPFPRFYSARKWMPLSWFTPVEGQNVILYGPYLVPLFAPVAESVNLTLVYRVRLQFGGQV
nr:capsid protein [Tundra vole stool-associated circular virus]